MYLLSEQGIRRVRFLHSSLHILCFDICIDWQKKNKRQDSTLCILPLKRAKLKNKQKTKRPKTKNKPKKNQKKTQKNKPYVTGTLAQ